MALGRAQDDALAGEAEGRRRGTEQAREPRQFERHRPPPHARKLRGEQAVTPRAARSARARPGSAAPRPGAAPRARPQPRRPRRYAATSSCRIERPAEDQHVPRLLLAARGRAFERHQQPGLELGPRALQLARREPLAEPPHLVAQRRHQLGRFLLAGAGIDAEHAAVAIGVGEGIDRIDEAALLADLLEQARRHAAAERGRHHRGRRSNRGRRRRSRESPAGHEPARARAPGADRRRHSAPARSWRALAPADAPKARCARSTSSSCSRLPAATSIMPGAA